MKALLLKISSYTIVKDKLNHAPYNLWSCGAYLKNTTGFMVNHSSVESIKSEYALIGDTCLHIINPSDGYAFESLYVNNPGDLPATDEGYQVTFDIYYPLTNNYDLTIRFFATSSSYVDVIVKGSNNIQSITTTNTNYYKLELFTRANLTQTEYWISNIQIRLL